MKCSVNSVCLACNLLLYSYVFSSVLVLVESSPDDVTGNVSLSTTDGNNSYEKRTEKRSSPLHPIPSSSAMLIKDEDLSMMDRIQIPIIYHTPLGSGKPNAYSSYKSEIHPPNYILSSRPKSLRKPSVPNQHHSYPSHSLGNQAPQVFPLQNPFPPITQHAAYNSYSSQSFPPPHYSSSSQSSQVASSSDSLPKHPDLLYYQNFDKLCPASKPYPVYIEKKVPITIEKRVPYPVKVPYPVHHYHYDNVVHRNLNAEDMKDGAPPPPPAKDSKSPPKIGGLFTGGDKGGYKGDTKEEMYEAYDDNGGDEKHEDDYDNYDHYEKSSSREISRNVPRTVSIPRNSKPVSRNSSVRSNSRTIKSNGNVRLNKRNNQQPKKAANNSEYRDSNDRRFERGGSVLKTELKDSEDNKTIESIVLPQATTSVIGLRLDASGNEKNDE